MICMYNRFKFTFISVLLALMTFSLTQSAKGFALLGQFASYQIPILGYNTAYLGDLGGPMALGDEYRWNVPVVVYGFDETFVDYFGSKGMTEVGKAFGILNNLPPTSKMSAALTEFPLDTTRQNFRATTASLLDVKSFSLGYMMEGLGLANPERFTWLLYNRTLTGPAPQVTNYFVISRNYDPVTLLQTNAVNGAHYGYVVHEYTVPTFYDADEYQKVDPDFVGFHSVASYTLFANVGTYLTGLTRDDVGGLKYIYSPKNFNNEGVNPSIRLVSGPAAVPGTVGGGNVGGGVTVGVGATSPYGSSFGINSIATALPNPYDSPFGTILTNITLTNVVGGVINTNVVGGVTNTPGTNLPVNIALRAGVDKITFVQGRFDSLLGVSFKNITNTFSDRFVTNGAFVSQIVSRAITTPDVIFAAGDLGLINNLRPVLSFRSLGFTSFGANNTVVGTRAGPGVIFGPFVVIYNNILPIEYNARPGTGFDDTSATRFVRWGSYDGTDTEPTVYPQGASILDVENQVLTP
ncbi:MAG: hypothetical protein JWN25_3318 [Verrucomicrobiales bacterium]|nr:hypothetical protein [Verrucomicrobiales bacterium]